MPNLQAAIRHSEESSANHSHRTVPSNVLNDFPGSIVANLRVVRPLTRNHGGNIIGNSPTPAPLIVLSKINTGELPGPRFKTIENLSVKWALPPVGPERSLTPAHPGSEVSDNRATVNRGIGTEHFAPILTVLEPRQTYAGSIYHSEESPANHARFLARQFLQQFFPRQFPTPTRSGAIGTRRRSPADPQRHCLN